MRDASSEWRLIMREVKTGEIYRHFKGYLYQIVAVARHSETNEKYVVYQALYGDMQVWVRPYEMFVSEVDREKYPDVAQKYRFELLNTAAGALSREKKPQTVESEKAVNEQPEPGLPRLEEPKQPEDKEKPAEEFEGQVDERLLEFLDAPTCQDKINYLNLIRAGIDDVLINNIAAAMDITVDDGPIDARFLSLKSCLMTKARYECVRR